MNILNLPNFFVQRVEDHGVDYEVFATYIPEPDVCPHCAVVNPPVHKHGGKTNRFFDTPTHGKRAQIVLWRQRYRCLECERTFLELIPEVDETRRMTRRLVEWIEEESLRETFKEVSRRTGQDEKTIRLVFQSYTARMDEKHVVRAPEWMGIDEIKVCGNLCCVLANLKERTILDLLPERTQAAIGPYFTRLSDRRNIRLVTMDMWEPYRLTVRALMPGASIVADKFHVLRGANLSMHFVRKRVKMENAKQKTRLKKERYLLDKDRASLTPQEMLLLDHWLDNFPELKAAYDLKNGFYAVYQSETREEAQQQLDLWRSSVPPSVAVEFRTFVDTVGKWETEILNYFDYRETNAYVESLNRGIRDYDRDGRGYSFDVLRAKLLYGSGERKNAQPYGYGWMDEKMKRSKRKIGRIIPMLTTQERVTLGLPQVLSDGVLWEQAFGSLIPHEADSDDDS